MAKHYQAWSYLQKRLPEVAQELGVTVGSVRRYLKEGRLKSLESTEVLRFKTMHRRHRNGTQLRNSRELLASLIAERHCCELCGATGALQVHHILPRRYGGGENSANLMLVCASCHFSTIHRPGKYGIHTWAVEHGRVEPSQLRLKKDVLDKGLGDCVDGSKCQSAACG